jgi:pyruvate/2-oxoglutarate/acetoin dehydrogenase E1 component
MPYDAKGLLAASIRDGNTVIRRPTCALLPQSIVRRSFDMGTLPSQPQLD